MMIFSASQVLNIVMFAFILISRDRLFPESVVRNISYQMLQGVAFMHKNGRTNIFDILPLDYKKFAEILKIILSFYFHDIALLLNL